MRHVRTGSQLHFHPELFNMKLFYYCQCFLKLKSFIFIDTTSEVTKRSLDKHEFCKLVMFLCHSVPKLKTLELSPSWRVDLHCYWLVGHRVAQKCVALHRLSAHPSVALALSYSVLDLDYLHVLSLQASQLRKHTDILRRPLFTLYRFPRAHAVRTLKLTVTKHGHERRRINWHDIARNFPDLEKIYIGILSKASATAPINEQAPCLRLSKFQGIIFNRVAEQRIFSEAAKVNLCRLPLFYPTGGAYAAHFPY